MSNRRKFIKQSGLGAIGLSLLPQISFGKNKKVIFPVPYSVKKTMPYIRHLLKNGKFKPVIDREYSLTNISKAYEFVIGGKKTGNVVINI